MVWDKWGVRKKEYDRIKKYKRTKESEGLFNRTPSEDTLFKANTDSDSWDVFSFNRLSARDIKTQLRQEQTGIGSCLSNNECPTGYACIDAKCVKIYTRDGTTWGTCGEENVNFPCKNRGPKTKNECSSSRPGPGDCLDSGCGSGPKCCRQNGNGDIDCYCGDCESNEYGICNIYCDTTYKLFGTISAGCHKPGGVGLCDGNICDECSECETPFGGGNPKCERYELGDPFAPCWCNGCTKACEKCDTDPDSSDFGDCYFDGDNCYTCCSISNPECICGPLTELGGSISACSPYYGKSCFDVLRSKINALCEEKCATEPDPCAPTGSTSYCVEGSAPIDPLTNPEGPANYTCPEGKRCQYAGYLEGNGKTCYLFNTWVIDEIPDHCDSSDCNCHNDCPDCQLCGDNGKCYRDTSCDQAFDVIVEWGGGLIHSAFRSGGVGCSCGIADGTYASISEYTITNVDPENELYYFKAIASGNVQWLEPICRTDCSVQGNPVWPYTTYKLYKKTITANGITDVPFSDTNYPQGITYSTASASYTERIDGADWLAVVGNYGNVYWDGV